MSIPGVVPLGGLFGRSSTDAGAPGGGMTEQQMMRFVCEKNSSPLWSLLPDLESQRGRLRQTF